MYILSGAYEQPEAPDIILYHSPVHIHVRGMKKERRKKQAKVKQSNTAHPMQLMRDAEGRKKQARSYKQQGKATQHTQGSHFSKEK